MESEKRKIEVFSAGCPCCDDVITTIRFAACESDEVTILDMRKPEVQERAHHLGVRSVPAVTIDGKLADCCSGRGPDLDTLLAAGLGVPLS
jgi:hypothetical protein